MLARFGRTKVEFGNSPQDPILLIFEAGPWVGFFVCARSNQQFILLLIRSFRDCRMVARFSFEFCLSLEWVLWNQRTIVC